MVRAIAASTGWVCSALLIAVYLSPSVAGFLLRMTTAVFLAWGGVITTEQYAAFASDFHW